VKDLSKTLGERPRRRSSVLALLVVALAVTACVRDEEALTDAGATQQPTGSGGGAAGGGAGGAGGAGGGAAGDGTTPPPPDQTPPPVDPNAPPATPPMSDVAVFQQTLHPVLRDAGNFCVGCHGATQIPTFAVADATTAYNVITTQQKVNLDNPELSRVYLRPGVDRHNCGADMSCDAIAASVLAGIRAWAQQRPTMPPPTQQTLLSSKTSFAAGSAGSTRADGNLVAKFDFSEGSGTTTVDSSGVGAPITLTIDGMEWVEGGLRNVSGKAQANATDSRKLFDMIAPGGAFTIEAWITPANTTQAGPARIVSYSSGTATSNFQLGQNAGRYRFRNRTAASNANGDPFLEAATPDVAAALQHVVLTFDPAVGRKTYVDGALSAQETAPTTLAWANNQTFVLGNEVTNDRLWQGVFDLVAIHNKALSAAEVQQNFAAGPGEFVTLTFDVSSILGTQGNIEMLAARLDDASYVFARPTYVGAMTGVRVKNIRIAVNDTVPVAAQSFRRIDTVAMASGTQLSPLGAVIPLAQGPDIDQFHLEFEALGTRFGSAEPVAPSLPPAPLADAPEPALGIRSFSRVNDTMAFLTGIPLDNASVETLYTEIRDTLPATNDLLAFGSAQQVAIQRLAVGYCGQVVAVPATCDSFFATTNCAIQAATRTQIAGRVYDNLFGTNLANQPDRTAVANELVDVMNDLGCTAGCTAATARTALQATCAAALSSAAVTLN
jgi:hypothetical protein